MKRIRIGKDINVQWVLHAPTGVVLTSENLTIELKDPKGRQVEVDNFTLETLQDKFAVYFALRGTAFSQLGNYTFTAWLNKNQQGQSVVDAVNAFTLVGSTQAEDDLQSCGCGCLNTVTIDMQGDISYIGRRGDKGDKGNSAYEDAVANGYVGTLEQWLESLHGDDGFSPSASVTKVEDTATISITDKNGTTSTTIKDGKDGDDGISPQVSVSKVNGVTTITITDKDGVQSATINDGTDGNDAVSPTATVSKSGSTATISITDVNGTTSAQITDGRDGDDGISPTATVSKSGKVATISITDKNGTTSQQISDGTDGDDGYSPTVSISKVNGVTTITITDKNGEHSATINDGENPQEFYWVTYGTTTYADIVAANNAGKVAMCWYNNRLYKVYLINDSQCVLSVATTTKNYSITVGSNNTWSNSERSVPSSLGASDSTYSINSTNYSGYVPTMERMHHIFSRTLSREELTGWQDGYIDVTTTPITDTINPSSANTKYLRVEVNEGEVYCLNVKGGTASRAYAIADANKTPIVSASEDATFYYYYIKIPAGGKYLYLHSSLDLSTYKCYRIKTAKDVEDKINSLAQLFTIEYEDGTTENINIYSETVV